jgi:hypothetical protein
MINYKDLPILNSEITDGEIQKYCSFKDIPSNKYIAPSMAERYFFRSHPKAVIYPNGAIATFDSKYESLMNPTYTFTLGDQSRPVPAKDIVSNLHQASEIIRFELNDLADF